MAGRTDGLALGMIGAGVLFVYSGIKGKSVLAVLTAAVQGKSPATVSKANPITNTPVATGTPGSGSAPPGTSTAGDNTHNLIEIGKYLHNNGYSRAAAAGIAGCVAGESGGNPESVGSGGNGLIGWTPPKAGIVTGNPTADLNAQLPAIIEYNNAQGAALIAQLNAISNPVSAADFYSEKFERPLVTNSDVRPSIALLVYGAI